MSILNNLLGNASEVNIEKLQAEFDSILIPGEEILHAYRLFRDKWIFTNKRLILLNVQGVTGSKRAYHSIPYGSIVQFAIETSGTFEDDCELKLWVRGSEQPLIGEFHRGMDIRGLQRTLARHILQ